MSDKYYTQIDNNLIELLMRIDKASQHKIILCIARFTVGYHRDVAQLSVSYIAKFTGLSLRSVSRELGLLEKMGVITRTYDGESKTKSVRLNIVTDVGDDSCNSRDSDKADSINTDTAVRNTTDSADTQQINIYKYNNLNKESKETHPEEMSLYSFTLKEALKSWINLHNLNLASRTALFRIVDKYRCKYKDETIAEVVNQCIAESRGSIYFDRLENNKSKEVHVNNLWEEHSFSAM